MELMTERYFQRPIQHSHSASNLPDLLQSSGSTGRFENITEGSYPAIYTHRNTKSFAPWRPQSYFSSDRLSYIDGAKSAQLGPMVNASGGWLDLHELEGLRVPSVYSAARNALCTRYTLADWNKDNVNQLTNSEQARKKAEHIRESGERLGIEADDRTKRAQQEVGKLLGQRINDINYMKNQLNDEIDALVNEMNKLNDAKRIAEKVFAELENPLHITQECLYHREKRQSTDLVHDHPEKALLREIDGIKTSQDQVRNIINRAAAQLGILREIAELQESIDQLVSQLADTQKTHQHLLNVKSRLEVDLAIKVNSLYIDREKCLGLRKTFPMNPALIAPA
ncbi:unnamed protein product [Schistosoma turkestanicum]|nr:unnamed protein product [Schistosoma turkestanicum]